jgi:hypothetical protein
MTDLGLKTFNQLYPMMIRKYQDLIVDQNASEADKINQIIFKLNALGKLSNDVVRDWNSVYQWAMNDGLTQNVVDKINQMFTDGSFNNIIDGYSTQITNEFNTQLATTNTNIQQATTNAQTQIDLINQNQVVKQTDYNTFVSQTNTSLAQKANQTDVTNSLTLKADKTITDNIQSQVSSLASGAPKAVSLVSQMTDTTKNYVYTGTETGYTSGHWYYWNGSAWLDGGTYQSAGITDGSIGSTKLAFGAVDDTKIKGSIVGKNLFDKSKATAGYYVNQTNGILTASSSYYASDWIPILPNIQYSRVEYNGQFAFYDINKNYISGGAVTSTFTTPANAYYLRTSISNSNIDIEQVELGSSKTAYVPYSFSLSKLLINTSNLGTGTVGKSNLNFNAAELQIGKNKFNKDTSIAGSYVDNATGIVFSNPSYTLSDWIAVQPNTQYTYNVANRIAIYDANKVFITGYMGQATFTTPTNAAYIRISIPNANINTAQVEIGALSTSYEAYGYSIDKLIVPKTPDYFDLILPKELNIAVGRTIELYNKQVCQCGNINNYHFSWACDIGAAMKRKWTVTATSAMVGNHALTLNVYDNNLNLVATGTTTIKIVNVSTPITTPKNVLCMGDSLSASKPWLNEWKSLSDTMFGIGKLQFIGTQGTDPYKNEGYSGWSTNNFSTNFVSQIILTVSGVTTPPSSKKNYTVPDTQGSYTWNVESCNITNGSGTITLNINAGVTRTPLASGTITATDGAGTGDSSITYSSYVVGKSNPFWNSGTSQLDFNNYLTVNSLSKPDIVQIFLGANELAAIIGDYNAISAAQQSTINNMKTIVDAILAQWVGTKIYIVLTPFYADQNGLGLNYGSTNYKNELQMHMNVYALAKAMMAQFNTYNSAVTIVPIAQTMDSDYAYTPVQQAVNPRSAITELVETGMVHPGNEGYYQMADTMFSHFVGHYLDA